MGLPLAIKAHGDGDLALAEHHYKRALQQDEKSSVVYQNYGSLLRSIEKYDDAEVIFLQGISLFPRDIGILTNYANFLRESPKPKIASSIFYYLQVFRLLLSEGSQSPLDKRVIQCLVNAISILREQRLHHLTLKLINDVLQRESTNPSLILNLFLVLDEIDPSSVSTPFDTDELKNILLCSYEGVDVMCKLEILFGFANHALKNDSPVEAYNLFEKGISLAEEVTPEDDNYDKVRKIVTCNGWNLGCTLLKLQDLRRGWVLFEHGLVTPADGKQRWQRALSKPFDSKELILWRGESLSNKRILLLEEQAIGDVMMFCSLISSILKEADRVGLFLSPRLKPIYQRTLANYIESGHLLLFTKEDYKTNNIKPYDFDFQSPIGSICQYRFSSVNAYAPTVPCLLADPKSSSQLSNKYFPNGRNACTTVGISWRGGGKGPRIKQKSIEESLFFSFLQGLGSNIKFISLQYGKYKKLLSKWQRDGLDIVSDPSVNPLEDMDTWLSQVSLCDAVISVANTTIHGAGGLNIPTMCLLSRHADWRWFDDSRVNRSYWYPSVSIARQSSTNSWDKAFEMTTEWVKNDFAQPNPCLSTLAL
tara:strand:- start:617 stop:2392 length:1776 start_codon:yes stop_codon:yes gene_type:complete